MPLCSASWLTGFCKSASSTWPAVCLNRCFSCGPKNPSPSATWRSQLAKRGQSNKNPADCRRAMDLLAHVVNNQWERFDEIEVIALMELNAVWADFPRRFPSDKARFPVDERLKKLLDLDLRIVMT